MVDGTKEWVAKAGLAGFGLAAGFTLMTFLVARIEAPTIAALRSQVRAPTGYTANGGF